MSSPRDSHKMAELDAQSSQETDKMLSGSREEDDDLRALTSWQQKSRPRTLLNFILISLVVTVILESVLLMRGDLRGFGSADHPVNKTSLCQEPVIRREWRSLGKGEKDAFLSAVLCLYNQRSIFPGRGSAYDDIVFVHQYSGQAAHKHPSFLPWHRWFIHQFERTLRDQCNYQDPLPYWDWTVDWRDLANSSIWDNEEGFGSQRGKVEVTVPGQKTNGNCVSGPFKDVNLLHFNLTVRPHCLTRQFQLSKSTEHGTFSGELMSPEAMGELVRSQEYGTLRYGIEGLHDVIHNGVVGDMNTWSSTNDPIFWLHHAQLDRIWWKWQQEDPENRLMDYRDSPVQPSFATIHDDMEYLGLFENRTVSEVMRTDTELLCYKY